ncbi:hypothetical protein TSUD_27340 [Trifolium subterraneum]|uniref:Reverse transcriptase domain-containing protein n=1 Tax=Trifolium subterraneum TaxID=3900 RepID=A0A2Z6LVW6_TRISU|nr:hypothetical protein TSUD_27340 [Trifolium subterraneum]
MLSNDDNSFLLEPFAEEEVREIIWSCDGNKSPGPDGFNLNFLKSCWNIVKSDVLAFLAEFHAYAVLPKAMAASFLTLIPKKDHPQDLFDYRPICLIGCLYKILSKLLAARLKRVLGKLISNCQSAFLPQRQILDGVVVLNEIIDLATRRKDSCMLFKVDFETAYDTVNWGFLERMMVKMGFAEGWVKWIRACIFESSMSVLVNGSPTEDFKVCKGLRQGHPLSPFLFLIVAEGLTRMIRRAVEIGKFHGYKVNQSLHVQILQFADDTILMGDDSWENLWTIKTVLRGFELVSGLKINFTKSKLCGLNVDDRFLAAGASFLSFRSDAIPFKFLGIPVGANPRRRETWRPVVEAMSKRLSSWSGRHLSYGGRITLINSVLASPPLYGHLSSKLLRGELLSCGTKDSIWWKDLEEQELNALKELLHGFSLKTDCNDKWRWVSESNGLFTVKSCYKLLIQSVHCNSILLESLVAIGKLWKNDLPSKVGVFGWRLLLEKLPTRETLAHRGIVTSSIDLSCAFCSNSLEDINHLFFFCCHVRTIWKKLYGWIGLSYNNQEVEHDVFVTALLRIGVITP